MSRLAGPSRFGDFYEPPTDPDRVDPAAGLGATRSARRGSPLSVRRLLGLATVIAAAVVVVWQSSGGSSPPTTASGIARAINLRQSDLPGSTVAPAVNDTIGGQPQARINRCLGVGLQLVAYVRSTAGSTGQGISSPQFVSGSGLTAVEVSSSVAVFGSRSVVVMGLAAARAQLASQRLQSCLGQALDHVTYTYSDGARIALGGAEVYPVTSPVAGTDGTFAVEISMMLSGPAASIPVYLDVYQFGVGRDALALVTFAVRRPFSFAVAQQLAQVMVDRASGLPH